MQHRLSIAISPCPNDTFVFDNLLNAANQNFIFKYKLLDIAQLNQEALNAQWDIIKISCALVNQIDHNYSVLSTGGALGVGVGPLLIIKKSNLHINSTTRIAVPGINTTAHKLLKFAYPMVNNVIEMNFAQIEDAVYNEVVDAGVIIHENRFTYQLKGLQKIADLGNLWENQTNLPVPLGCIVIKKQFYPSLKAMLEKNIKQSLKKAWANYPTLSDFVIKNAQNMNKAIMKKHIELYVNKFTYDMQSIGSLAIQKLNEL